MDCLNKLSVSFEIFNFGLKTELFLGYRRSKEGDKLLEERMVKIKM